MPITKPNRPYVPKRLQQPIGAGDLAEIVFAPVAKVLGKEGCNPCVGPGGRKERWNKKIPNLNPLANGT